MLKNSVQFHTLHVKLERQQIIQNVKFLGYSWISSAYRWQHSFPFHVFESNQARWHKTSNGGTF